MGKLVELPLPPDRVEAVKKQRATHGPVFGYPGLGWRQSENLYRRYRTAMVERLATYHHPSIIRIDLMPKPHLEGKGLTLHFMNLFNRHQEATLLAVLTGLTVAGGSLVVANINIGMAGDKVGVDRVEQGPIFESPTYVLPGTDIKINIEDYAKLTEALINDENEFNPMTQAKSKGFRFSSFLTRYDIRGGSLTFKVAAGGADRLRVPFEDRDFPLAPVEKSPAGKEVVIYRTIGINTPDNKFRVYGLTEPWNWFKMPTGQPFSEAPNRIGDLAIEPSWYAMDKLQAK